MTAPTSRSASSTSASPSSQSYKFLWRLLTMGHPAEAAGTATRQPTMIINDDSIKRDLITMTSTRDRRWSLTKQPTKWHRSRRKPSPTFDNNNLANYYNQGQMCYNDTEDDYDENNNCDTIDHHHKLYENSNNNKDNICPHKGPQRSRVIKNNYLLNSNLHSIITTLIVIINVLNIIITDNNENFVNCLVINIKTKSQQQQQISTSATSNHKLFKRSPSLSSNTLAYIGNNNDTTSTWNKRQQPSSSSAGSEQQQQQQSRTTTTRSVNSSANNRSAKLQSEIDAFAYLQRYGYMNETMANANLVSEDSFQEAVMSFQRFAGIPETGSIDSMTVKYMQMPRCGNKDQSGKGENGKRKRRKRRKRYALQGSKWRRQELTYRISQYPTRFLYKKSDVDGQIEKAFKIWSQVAPINFVVKKEGRVHIDIRFASGEHGDGDPFDGPGNTLAHAYFPQYGGDAHFDDQEYWTVDSYAGTNIFQVAAHELGHSLGLGHSSVREALMAPFYQKYKPNFKLHADDVLAIQALYGEKGSGSGDDGDSSSNDSPSSSSTTTTTESSADVPSARRRPTSTTTTTTTTPAPEDDDDNDSGGGFFGFGGRGDSKPVDLCQDSKIDAITRTEDGNTYVFRGKYYWQIKNEGLASGFPAKIARDWDGLPSNLDAALTWSDGKTFFFKGDKYWRFFNKRREPGYPKLISAGFAGIPNNVDAAFVWSGNGKTYFFKRDKYWRFDSKQEPPVSSQYPKSIKNWSGLPTSGIDAAFKWDNGMTYFFKDELYYRFDDREFEVDSAARPSFPRSTAEWWFGCTNSNLPFRQRPSSNNGLDDNSGNNNADKLDQASLATSSSANSLLLFHRKPNLTYDKNNNNNDSDDGGEDQLAQSSRTRPAGNSISRSILSTLSALFPSSSSSSSARESPITSQVTDSKDAKDDWSFHRGIGEEVRRAMKSARAVPSNENSLYKPTSYIYSSHPSRSASSSSSSSSGHPDTSRWLFPLGSSFGRATSGQSPSTGASNREQSLSELRMAPTLENSASNSGTTNNNETFISR